MGFMETLNKANYYSDSNKEQGWYLEINDEIIKSNIQIITPEIAQEEKINLAPKQTLTNPIENYDDKKIIHENHLDQIIMLQSKMEITEEYGRSK